MGSYSFCLFNKINFYAGVAGDWGIGIEISTYDRSITINFIKFYIGVELWYNDGYTDFVPKSKGDLLD